MHEHHLVSSSIGVVNRESGRELPKNYHGIEVDTGSADLIDGDIFLLVSDGLSRLSDEQFVEALRGFSPEKGRINLMSMVSGLNLEQTNIHRLKNGKDIVVSPALDNASALVFYKKRTIWDVIVDTLRNTKAALM